MSKQRTNPVSGRDKLWALLADKDEYNRAINCAKRLGKSLGRVLYLVPGAGEGSYINMLNMPEVCSARIWANQLAKRTAKSLGWKSCSVAGMEFGFLLGCEFYFWYYSLVQYALLLEAMEKDGLGKALLVSTRIPLQLRVLLPLWARRQGIRLYWLGSRKEKTALLVGAEMVKALLLRPIYDWLRSFSRLSF